MKYLLYFFLIILCSCGGMGTVKDQVKKDKPVSAYPIGSFYSQYLSCNHAIMVMHESGARSLYCPGY